MTRTLNFKTVARNKIFKQTERIIYASDENFAKLQIYHDKLQKEDEERRRKQDEDRT